jgi:hypothetical protein
MSRPCATWPIFDDDQDTVRTRACFPKVAGHTVTIWNGHTKDVGVLAVRLKDTRALALMRERTPIPRALLVWADKVIQCVYGDRACFCFIHGALFTQRLRSDPNITAQCKAACESHSVSVLRKNS